MDDTGGDAGFFFVIFVILGGAMLPAFARHARHMLREGHALATVIGVFCAALALAFAVGMACLTFLGEPGLSALGHALIFTIVTLIAFILVAPFLIGFVGGVCTPRRRAPQREGPLPVHRALFGSAIVVVLVFGAVWLLRPVEASFVKWPALVCIGLLALNGWGTFRQARKARALEAALKQDERPPVLYLREFMREGEPFMASYSIELESLESVLSTAIEESIGPFVALGDPEDFVQPGGAARMYAAETDWRASVEALVRRSCAILLQPGGSVELLWELSTLLQSGQAEKLFVAIGSTTFQAPQPTWVAFRSAMQRAGYELPPLLASDFGLIAFDRHGHGTVYDCAGDPESYVTAMASCLARATNKGAGAGTDPVLRKPASGRTDPQGEPSRRKRRRSSSERLE